MVQQKGLPTNVGFKDKESCKTQNETRETEGRSQESEGFDSHCEKRCNEDDEMMLLDHLRERVKKAFCDLADLIDGCCRLSTHLELSKRDHGRMLAEIQRTPPQRIVDLPVSSGQQYGTPVVAIADEWISYDQAEELLEMTKSTVSKWAKQGRFTHNGQAGPNRRLSRTSVILAKQQYEDQQIKRAGKKNLKEKTLTANKPKR